jgi:hypothetical protein
MLKTLTVSLILLSSAAYADGVSWNYCNGDTRLEFVSPGVMIMIKDGWKDAYLDSGSIGTGMPNRLYIANHDEETRVGVVDSDDGSSVILSRDSVDTVYKRCD